MRRVVITGIGIYSCLGTNVEAVSQALYDGRSGIGFDPARKDMGFRSGLTAILEKPELKGLLHRRNRNYLAEEGEYAFMATREAIAMAGMTEDFLENNEVGVLYGNDSTAKAVFHWLSVLKEKKDTTLLGSGAIFQSMNSTVTMNLATIFKLKGINYTISAACASGSHSLGMGYMFIKHGYQDQVICGGAQEVNYQSMASFDGLSAFSTRESDPTAASRPFDRDRDGLVPSGGAATIILESYESAVSRGAEILGELVGYGFSSNGEHISQPSVIGPARALKMSIKDANLQVGDIDYINAHATSTPLGDSSEAKAIHQVFGSANTPISSTKSMTGHECWMAGASEVVYGLLMMKNSFIAPNINLENPDDDAIKLNIVDKTINKNIDVFLSNSFGFGGTNSSLIVKKFSK